MCLGSSTSEELIHNGALEICIRCTCNNYNYNFCISIIKTLGLTGINPGGAEEEQQQRQQQNGGHVSFPHALNSLYILFGGREIPFSL